MNDLVQFVLNVGPVAKVVLLILSIFSIVSWSIIFEKIGYFYKIGKESKRFMRLFKERTGWESLHNVSRSFRYSPYPQIFRKAYGELYAWKRRLHIGEDLFEEVDKSPIDAYPTALPQIMESSTNESLSRVDKHLIFLAITISVSPFLGLFGTVWGVMRAFMSIGMKGSADISTVGPGIAEALITTVTGLAVAIPALIAYNLFVSRLHKLEDEAGIFSSELIRLFEREKVL